MAARYFPVSCTDVVGGNDRGSNTASRVTLKSSWSGSRSTSAVSRTAPRKSWTTTSPVGSTGGGDGTARFRPVPSVGSTSRRGSSYAYAAFARWEPPPLRLRLMTTSVRRTNGAGSTARRTASATTAAAAVPIVNSRLSTLFPGNWAAPTTGATCNRKKCTANRHRVQGTQSRPGAASRADAAVSTARLASSAGRPALAALPMANRGV